MSCKDKIPMTPEEEGSLNKSIFNILAEGLGIIDKRKQEGDLGSANQFNVGDKVKCVNGRFKGYEGIVSHYDLSHGRFCMRIEPEVGERVNPDNWILK